MSIPHKAFLAMLAEKQQILRDNHLIDTTENMREDLQESHCGSMRVDEPLKGRGYPYNEKTFKPHMMYDPKTGKGYKANTYKDHLRMDKMGYTHEKPKVKEEVEQVDEWWSKQANPQSKGWKSATVKMNFKSFNAAGEGPNLYKKGTKLFYHPVKLGKGDPVVVATPDVKKAGKYFSVHPDRLGLKGFVSATGTLKDHVELEEGPATQNPLVTAFGGMKAAQNTPSYKKYMKRLEKERKERQAKAKKKGMRENPEYDPELGEMNIGEETIDEMSAKAHYKSVMRGGKGKGFVVSTPIDRNRYPNREKEGLEGPYKSRKSGKIFYYDKKEGKYYDPDSDMFLKVSDVMESQQVDEKEITYLKKKRNKRHSVRDMRRSPDGSPTDGYYKKKGGKFAHRSTSRTGLKYTAQGRRRDINPKYGDLQRRYEEVELDEFELNEKFEFQFADKEKAMAFSRKVVYDKIASSSSVYDTNKVTVFGPHQAGVGSPTRAHQQIAKAMKKFGGKLLSTNEGPRMKKVFKEDIDMINEDDVERREIELFTSNHAQIYRQRIQPIIKNLARKKAKGTYDDKLAIKAWTYAVNDGIKAYNKEFGSSIKLSKAEKDKAAEYLLKHFEDE